MSIHRQVGDHLIEVLTQQEIIHLLDALWSTLPAEMHDIVLDQLAPDTRQTVQHILSPPQPTGDSETTPVHPVSIAKLEQTWSKLWQEWDQIVTAAADEEGPYMTQEVHWEPPYFDQTAFINDLQNFVPKPEAAQKSDYTSHAHWMAALRELAPDSYETLLDKWRTEHHRRRNLWQAMARLGLN